MPNAHINDSGSHSTRAQQRQWESHLETIRRALPEVRDEIRIKVAQETAGWDPKGFKTPVEYWDAVGRHAQVVIAQNAQDAAQPFKRVARDGSVYGRRNPSFSPFHINSSDLRHN